MRPTIHPVQLALFRDSVRTRPMLLRPAPAAVFRRVQIVMAHRLPDPCAPSRIDRNGLFQIVMSWGGSGWSAPSMLRCRVARLCDYLRVRGKGFEALDLHLVKTHAFNDIRFCLVGNIGVTNHFACILVALCCFRHLPHQLTNSDFLLRPACLVSNRRGVDVNGGANNPRISPIYRTDKYFIYVNSWPVPCALNPQNTTLFCAVLRCPNWVRLARLVLGWGNLAGYARIIHI